MKLDRTNAPKFYMLSPGLLLRRLTEVEACAASGGRPVADDVYDWIKSVALELACQVDEPTDPLGQELLETTMAHFERHSHPGNASGKRGRPAKNKID